MLLVAIFAVGYLAIVFEHSLKLNKSASALLTGILCWTAYIVGGDRHAIHERLLHHLAGISQIVFFLLAAMTIVELIDAHDGFELITSRVNTTNRRRMLVTIAALAFFLSAVLDNLTASIVMMSLVRKLTSDADDRMHYGGVVIIAANSGGAWSPIGDVTTTMLWVGNQISATKIIGHVFLPAVVSLVVPLLVIGLRMNGDVRRATKRARGTTPETENPETKTPETETPETENVVDAATSLGGLTSVTLPGDAAAVGKSLVDLDLRARTGASVITVRRGDDAGAPAPREPLRDGDVVTLSGSADRIALAVELLVTGQAPKPTTRSDRLLVLLAGFAVLLFVPVFKALTHLPPVMGILLGLGALWTLTELLHKRKPEEGREALSVAGALQRVDSPSILFFLGILLAISALESDGVLASLAQRMDRSIGNVNLITIAIGLTSSVVDNVPLVAAAQGMYPLSAFPTDNDFWLFLAYCAGTGGSILIIGSAAGIAVMGMQRVSFGWYFRKLSLPALLGYLAGALTYIALVAMRR